MHPFYIIGIVVVVGSIVSIMRKSNSPRDWFWDDLFGKEKSRIIHTVFCACIIGFTVYLMVKVSLDPCKSLLIHSEHISLHEFS